MVNLRFNFKMDLVDISTIDFAFANSYAELETDPFLTKSFPEDGEHSQRSIILTLNAEEAELLPEQFYALATVNFKNGETIKAHAFKNTAKEEALSAALALEDTEFNINFFIDEVAGGGSGVDAYINGVKLEGYKTAAELDLVKASENIKIWDIVYNDDDEVSFDPADYPGIKMGDFAIDKSIPHDQIKMWMQVQSPDSTTVYWIPVKTDQLKYFSGDNTPPTTCEYQDVRNYSIGDFYIQDNGGVYILIKMQGSYGDSYTLTWMKLQEGNDYGYKPNIYEPVFNQDGSLNNDKANYPGVKQGDLIIYQKDGYSSSHYRCPQMWQVGEWPYSSNTFPSIYMTHNTYSYSSNELPTGPEHGSASMPHKGEVWQVKNGKYYLCANVTNDGSNPAQYSYEWQEVIMVPKPTSNDVGKVLTVNADGDPEWVTL